MRNRLLILAVWLLGLSTSLVPATTSAAASFTYNTTVTFKVAADGTTAVREDYIITNNTPREYLSGLKISTPTDSITGLAANYSDGVKIPATSTSKSAAKGDITYKYQEVALQFPRQTYGQGKTWKFSVLFTATGLADAKGGAHTVYVPQIEAGSPDDQYNVTVDVPDTFGAPHFSGAKAESMGTSTGRQFYNFAKSDLVDHALALAFGDNNVYQVDFKFPLSNDTPLPATRTITLPPDLNNQKVRINQLDPKPDNTRLDEDGNILADYHLGAHQKLTVHTTVTGTVKFLEYDLTASGKKGDIPADLAAQYTKASTYWPTSGPVAEQAAKLSDPNAPVVNNVKAMYQFVIDKLDYNKDKIKFNIRQGAAKALANPKNAVCLEYSDLLIAMLRSQGIPARMPIGYGYSGSLKQSSSVADSLHSWVEAYVPGIGWMTLDPTWGEKFDQFGKSDLDHFAFAVWGTDDSQPTAVMAGDRDQGYQYGDTALQYLSQVPGAPKLAGTVAAKRWLVLPFLGLDQITVHNQTPTAIDSNHLKIGGQSIDLGSLAPDQRVTINRFNVGTAWSQPLVAEFNHQNGRTLVLATTRAAPTWWLLWSVTAAVLFAGVLTAVIRLRIRRRLAAARVPRPTHGAPPASY
jgi:transglutaminase-like putative cysteine protease